MVNPERRLGVFVWACVVGVIFVGACLLGSASGCVVAGGFLGSLAMSFELGFASFAFLVVGTYVTMSILMFSGWYMGEEPSKEKFLVYLVIFLGFMMLLVFSDSLVTLMVGWEGVGIMSFLLIAWWWARGEASLAAVQAIFYNRLGDFGLYLSIFGLVQWGAMTCLSAGELWGGLVGFAILVGAMAKSSQFAFHPWLPNAMEGPTPVSSLLHSSTMVVAGVYLLIRVGPLVGGNLELIVGTLTMMYGALCAFGQTDLKKVVAFSTTSQLGLMMASIGLGLGGLAFFHLCMHAFFKSLIFISSGVFIHAVVGQSQDFRAGAAATGVGFLSLLLSSMSLGSFPFMSGFYSKDLLLENSYGPVSNRFAVVILILSSLFTVGYSAKLVVWLGASWFRGVAGSGLVGGVEVPTLVWLSVRLVATGLCAGLITVGVFGLFEESCLPVVWKVVPLLIFLLSLGLCWGSSDVVSPGFLNMGVLMYSYNPLMHRLVVLGLLGTVGRALVFFEYFWWEAVYSLSAFKFIGGLSSATLPGMGGGLRSYFFWLILLGSVVLAVSLTKI